MKRRWLWIAVSALAVAVLGGLLVLPRLIERSFNRVLRPGPYAIGADATEFEKTLFVADLHADSLLWGRNLLKYSSIGHVDIPRLQQANISLQFFTVVTTVPRNLNITRNRDSSDVIRYLAMLEGWPPRTWSSPKRRALYQAARLERFARESHGELTIVRTRSDLQRFMASRPPHAVAAILGAEGTQPLEGRLENLDDLYAAGFRMMSPTHFTDTAVSGAAAGERKSGLSELGRRWVRAMEQRGMLIDLAHASPATIHDVTAIATKPVIVSHTGVKGTCNNNRNLSDEELRAVARTGGVVGIGYFETAVCGHDADAIARAIRYAVGVIGAEHVALGSDFDGAVTVPFDATGVPLIISALRKSGMPDREIRLVAGENVLRVLSETLPQ